jgi:hypothetical protein
MMIKKTFHQVMFLLLFAIVFLRADCFCVIPFVLVHSKDDFISDRSVLFYRNFFSEKKEEIISYDFFRYLCTKINYLKIKIKRTLLCVVF